MKSYVNTLLDDSSRILYIPTITKLTQLCPEMMSRKIPEANVQQAFIFDYVYGLALQYDRVPKTLCVGCFEDTAYESLVKLNLPVIGIDPYVDGNTLRSFFNSTSEKFDIIFSTSVIEHVKEDEEFIEQICKLLNSGGSAVLTTDFKNDWKQGDPLPATDERFYSTYDLNVRLRNIIENNGCEFVNKTNWHGLPNFIYQGHHYSFATIVFRKKE